MPNARSNASLRALNAFSTVARAGSVVAAAEELAVTPSALSHLIRELERQLGVALFTRRGRGLNLTLEGERLATAVGPALLTIDDALIDVSRRGAELRISLLSSFAVHWLIPRLSRFQVKHPDIELLLSTSTRPVDLSTEAFDCAIRLGRGGWAGVMGDELYREELIAACSPKWLATRRLRAPKDLLRATLLHARARRQDWAHWFNAAGITEFKANAGPVFETRALAIQAAIAQMGIMVVDPRFIEAETRGRPAGTAVPAADSARGCLLATLAPRARNHPSHRGLPPLACGRGETFVHYGRVTAAAARTRVDPNRTLGPPRNPGR